VEGSGGGIEDLAAMGDVSIDPFLYIVEAKEGGELEIGKDAREVGT
jgi:hypothetical protein